ncbi:MAG: outer membrane beta-barrel protein [Rhodobacteraceae bacterium]|nr:outer membrane beta-barrel protein [Paracoccaceae bacterium]
MRAVNSISRLAALAVACTLSYTSTASAEGGFYWGGGFGLSSAESLPAPGFPFGASDTFPVVGITAGYRVDGANHFWAAEADTDISFGSDFVGNSGSSCPVYADGPYYCTHNATLRLRGVFGMPINSNYEGFGSVGLVAVRGTSAIGPTVQADAVNTGYTLSAGVQRATARGLARAELIYDRADTVRTNNGGYAPQYEALTLKISLLF